MPQPKLPGKHAMTINLIDRDVDLARQIAAARGVSTAGVLRDAIRLGLPLLIEREADMLGKAEAKRLSKVASKTAEPLPVPRRRSP